MIFLLLCNLILINFKIKLLEKEKTHERKNSWKAVSRGSRDFVRGGGGVKLVKIGLNHM